MRRPAAKHLACLAALCLPLVACKRATSERASWRADCPPLVQAEPLSLEAARDAQRVAARRHELRLREAATPGSFLREMRAALDPARVAAGRGLPRRAGGPRAAPLRSRVRIRRRPRQRSGCQEARPGRFAACTTGVFGGPETISCPSCHWIGGPNGAGAETDTAFLSGDGVRTASGDERNPPALVGLGVVQALAREMSRDLQRQRDDLARDAARAGAAREGRLVAKGVDFGRVRVTPAGEVDTSGVSGVDADLVVKPFGWKGTLATFTDFAAEALQIHLGIQSDVLLESNVLLAVGARSLLGDGDDPADPDGDGMRDELGRGPLAAMTAHLALLEIPDGRAADPEPPARPGRPGVRSRRRRRASRTTSSAAAGSSTSWAVRGATCPCWSWRARSSTVEGLPPIDLARDMRQPGLR